MEHGLFSFHTKKYKNAGLLCGGNGSNHTAVKFLHNTIRLLLNPNGKALLPNSGRKTDIQRETKSESRYSILRQIKC